MKAFHALLSALYGVERPPSSGPLPPRDVLRVWSDASEAVPSKNLTRWGAFLQQAGLVDVENPVIWSSVNASHFDRTRQLFRSDQEVRNWFPVLLSDQKHVDAVHAVGADADARARFLSASYIAEGFQRASQSDYLNHPWVLGKEFSEPIPSSAVTIGLRNSTSGARISLHHPSDGIRDLGDLFLAEDMIDAPSRFLNFLKRITLPNTRNPDRTAKYLLRVAAGRTESGHHLLEFYHAIPQQPTSELIDDLVAVTDIGATAIQSVLAPTIIQEVESARHGAFFSDVVAHDIQNWRENVAASVESLRDSITSLHLPARVLKNVSDNLTLIEFDNEILKHVLDGFSWRPFRREASLEAVELASLIDWVSQLPHPRLKDGKFNVKINGEPEGVRIAGETNVVLANLIRNAMKANQDQKGTQIVVAITVDSSNVMITVASKKRFNYGDWSASLMAERRPKTNRGLWFCRQLLAAQGSDLQQKNEPGFGCCLAFSVPRL